MNFEPLLPGNHSSVGQPITLGVMGGGQLGRMFVQAAQAMGYFTAVLDPDPASPAGLISHHHIQTAYDDPAGLAELAKLCDAITTEFENVPAPALRKLAETRPVAPSADCVAVAQDRLQEKAHFVQCAPISGVFPAPYAGIETAEQLAAGATPMSSPSRLMIAPGTFVMTRRLPRSGAIRIVASIVVRSFALTVTILENG